MEKRIGSRKGQVSLFIILGVVILILLALAYYFVTKASTDKVDTIAEDTSQNRFQSQSEVSTLVQKCLERSALSGLEILRLQGGFIENPQDGSEAVPTLPVVDTANGFVVANKRVAIGEGANSVRYWVEKDKLLIPELGFIESQLEAYVVEQTKLCVDNFSDFQNQGYQIEAQEPQALVTLADAVTVSLWYPITLSRDGNTVHLDDFTYQVPINFFRIYTMAYDIAQYEHYNGFLEDASLKAITFNEGVSPTKYPPLSDFRVSFLCDTTTWILPNVERKFKSDIASYLQDVHVNNTNFTRKMDADPLVQGTYDGLIHTVFEDTFPSHSVVFSYRPQWQMEFDVKPRAGQLIKGDSSSQSSILLVPLLCMNNYQFKYTISQPVLVTITDSESARINALAHVYEEKKGFVFQFALRTNILGNQNRRFVPYDLEEEEIDPQILAELGIEQKETMFCSEGQKRSSELAIHVLDKLSYTNVSSGNLYYSCGTYKGSCLLGTTGQDGMLRTKLPLCVNGKLTFVHKDYAPASMLLSTHGSMPASVELPVFGRKEMHVKFKKMHLPLFVRNYQLTQGFTTTAPNDALLGIINLGREESVVLSGQQGKESIAVAYPPQDTITLGPGTYTLDSTLMGEITILNTSYAGGRASAEGFGPQSYPLGTLAAMKWEVKPEDLMGHDTITFIIPSEFYPQDLQPGTWHDIDDPLMKSDGHLGAELLLARGIVREIDGNATDDFSFFAGFGMGTSRVMLSIPKDTYQAYLQPRFE